MPPKKTPKKTKSKSKSAAKDLRASINVLAIIEALERHILEDGDMTSTQVSAALALLKKTLPDISESNKGSMNEAELQVLHEDALRLLE